MDSYETSCELVDVVATLLYGYFGRAGVYDMDMVSMLYTVQSLRPCSASYNDISAVII